jgi:hypothetical protein
MDSSAIILQPGGFFNAIFNSGIVEHWNIGILGKAKIKGNYCNAFLVGFPLFHH